MSETGEDIAAEPVRLTVHAAETARSIEGITPKQGRIFLIADISIENCGMEPGLSFDEQMLTVNDYTHSDGITFKMGTRLDTPLDPCDIPMGDLRRGQVIFGVPEDDDLYAIRLRDESGEVMASADIRQFFGDDPLLTPSGTAPPSPCQAEYVQLHAEMAALNAEVAGELDLLPEIRDGISAGDVEAVEDIVALYRNGDATTRNAFDRMLDEGIRDGRSYSTPLQALLWIGYDRELSSSNPLRAYSLESLLEEAWEDTAVSANYRSDKWDEFDEVVERLNSPRIVEKYYCDNLVFDRDALNQEQNEGAPHHMRPPEEVFRLKKGICNELARFALKCLLENGYAYAGCAQDDFGRHEHAACCLGAWSSEIDGLGHVTCLYQDGDGEFYIIDSRGTPSDPQGGIKGPFATLEEAAEATCPGGNLYEFKNIFCRRTCGPMPF